MATTRARSARLKVVDEHSQQLHAAVAVMTDEMLECRDIQHSYRKWSVRWIPKDREYESKLKCQRCGSIRVRRIDGRTGAIMASSYEYAEGYLVKGLGRLTGSDRGFIRLASLQQDTADVKEA
jgi:hypothetical protein